MRGNGSIRQLWGAPELLKLDHEPFKGELGIGVHRKMMPELLEQVKKLEETFNRQGTGQGSEFGLQIRIVQRERGGNLQEHQVPTEQG